MENFFKFMIAFCLLLAVWDAILLLTGDPWGWLFIWMLLLAWWNYHMLQSEIASKKRYNDYFGNGI